MTPCGTPLPLATLVDYWIDGGDDAERIEEHFLGCEECSNRLAEVVALGEGIRAAFQQGAVKAFLTEGFVRQLLQRGVRIREYRIALNGSVNCSVSDEDDLVLGRLAAPLEGVTRLDVISYVGDEPGVLIEDVPFDASRGEVLVAPKMTALRAMPSRRHIIRLVSVEPEGERVLGEYTLNHTGRPPA